MTGIFIAIVAGIVALCAILFSGKPDTPVERAAEDVIDFELGIPEGTIDFSKALKLPKPKTQSESQEDKSDKS